MYFPARRIHLPNFRKQSAVGRERPEIPLCKDVRGGVGEKKLTELETIFREDKRKAVRNTIRNRVERYETRVKIRAEQLEQATVKERKAYELLQDAEQLRKNNYS